jgi:CheY-like chemotaxis protein
MKQERILLVEDSEPLRTVLAEKLRDEDLLVYEAGSAEEGLRIGAEQHPEVIITDIVMFPMDGLTMVKKIRESGGWGAEVRIIALTNQNQSEEEQRVKDLDLTAYLVKSDTGLDDVVSLVKDTLHHKRSKKDAS